MTVYSLIYQAGGHLGFQNGLALTWSSTVISVVRVLSVFHFWLKLRPRSLTLYLVSRWPPAFPVSVLLVPEVANS